MKDSCFFTHLKKNFKKKRTEDIIESPISSMQCINTKNMIPVYGILEIIRTIYKKGIIRGGPEPFCKKTINVNPFKPVHFRFKGCWVVFFIFIQILIEHSISKQWRP